MDIRLFDDSPEVWDKYVIGHENSTLYHLFAWGKVLEEALGHKRLYLAAYLNAKLIGIFPLMLVKSRLFGSALISLPFLNYGGVCADSEEATCLLYQRAISLAKENRVDYFQIRNIYQSGEVFPTSLDKATFILRLSDCEEDMFKSFRKQTKNRIRKALEHRLKVERGHKLLHDFYSAFSIAMKEHGTPVLGLKFFHKVLEHFGNQTEFYVAYQDKQVVGSKLTISFKDTVYQIWGGVSRKISRSFGQLSSYLGTG